MKAMNEWVGGLVGGSDGWTGRLVGACRWEGWEGVEMEGLAIGWEDGKGRVGVWWEG